MISEKMVTLGTKKSVIREIFEYSKKRAAEIGTENVFDFSIGNPNVPAPASVHETIKELLDSKNDYYLFGYTSAQGDADTRAAVAADLNKRFGTTFHADNFYMTCGAAASLRIVLGALTVPGDEWCTSFKLIYGTWKWINPSRSWSISSVSGRAKPASE